MTGVIFHEACTLSFLTCLPWGKGKADSEPPSRTAEQGSPGVRPRCLPFKSWVTLLLLTPEDHGRLKQGVSGSAGAQP